VLVTSADTRLPMTPGIGSTESYPGYVLRLSELNGFMTPARMLERCEPSAHRMTLTMTDPQLLARLTGRESTAFLYSAYKCHSDKRAKLSLAGHDVFLNVLRPLNTRVCRACVVEKKVIEAHFDLQIMVGCPEHTCMLDEFCGSCGKHINWQRPGLLECICGSDLGVRNCGSLTDVEAEFLEIIRRKLHRIPLESTSRNGFSLVDLDRMRLNSLLYLSRTLGRRVTGGQAELSLEGYSAIAKTAASVLSNWPDNAIRWFEEIGPTSHSGDCFTLGNSHLRSIYSALLERTLYKSEFGFVRDAFSLFARRQGNYGCRTCAQIESSGAQEYVTMKSFAKEVGINPGRVRRVVELNGIEALKTYHRSSGLLIKREALQQFKDKGIVIFSLRSAAARLGVPASVLREMRRRGVFVAKCRPTIIGYHEGDLAECEKRIVEAADRVRTSVGSDMAMVPLGRVFRSTQVSVSEKTKFLERMLSGEIEGSQQTDGTISGILIPQSSMRSVSEDRRYSNKSMARCAKALKCSEVAAQIGMKPEAIGRLIREGYLDGVRIRYSWSISAESLVEFQSKYRSLAGLAKDWQLVPSALTRACVKTRIEYRSVAESGVGNRFGFIRVEDVSKLREALNSRIDSSRRRAA
jgi:hypothetical protein